MGRATLKDIHPAVWLWFPPLMWLVLLYAAFIAPELVKPILSLDHQHQRAGLVENGTVAVLIPGIIAGIIVVVRYASALPNPGVRIWLGLWTLGALYFALEEVSWGQWWFGWDSPDVFIEHNEQQETNLHNMSAWLNRRPRVVLELWILAMGLAFPLWRWLTSGADWHPSNWRHWVIPTQVVLVTSGLYLVVRICRWFDHPTFGNTEFREYYIAVFISVYLLSCWARARAIAQSRPT
ncbi:MAG: hypothetical protein AAF493_21915 [Pseudomonadota bacterium]